MNQAEKAVLYLRVSTDDRDQNPERQAMLLQTWCDKHGVEVVATVVDNGTSATKTNPFERPKFMEALEMAEAISANILIEKLDRFCRQGGHEYGWAITELKRRPNSVELWIVSKGGPEDQAREVIGPIMDTMEAEVAAKNMRDHSERVASGMATAAKHGTKTGRPIGRQPKPITAKELAAAKAAARGVRGITNAINEGRGLFKKADIQAAIKKHGVSKSLVAEYLNGARVAE